MGEFFCFVLLNFLFLKQSICLVFSPIVQTRNGPVRGALIQWPDAKQEVYAFTGIPFGEPPIGERRFGRPLPKTPWSSVLNATKPTNACIQFNSVGPEIYGTVDGTVESEDCLYLNVWVPKSTLILTILNGEPLNPLPVYIYIHGGAFRGGSSMSRVADGTIFSGRNNVIFVTIQYRLGMLGFAYFGQDLAEDAPGNAGLWDQLLALKWVRENIGSFGGDSNEVTLGGQSAGAASVTYHLLSPYSRRYFQRAIAESGSALCDWALLKNPRDALARTNDLAQLLRCRLNKTNDEDPPPSMADNLRCLRAAPVRQIVRANGDGLPFVDGDFIPLDPVEILTSGQFYKCPLLIGFTHEESSWAFQGNSLATTLFESRDELNYTDFNKLSRIANSLIGGDQDQLDRIRKQYWPVRENRSEIIDRTIQIVSDYQMICPIYYWANYTAWSTQGSVPVYVFHFTQRDGKPAWIGAYHALERDYIFGKPFAEFAQADGYSEDDRLFSDAIMQFWANFMKTGNPGQISLRYAGCDRSNKTTTLALNWPDFVGADQRCRNQVIELNRDTLVYNCRKAVTCDDKASDCTVCFFYTC